MTTTSFPDFRRRLMSAFVILLLMHISGMFEGPPAEVGFNLLIGLSYASLPLFSREWWTIGRLLVATGVLAAESAVAVMAFQEGETIYLLAVWLVSLSVRLSLSRTAIPLISVLFLAATLYIRYGRDDVQSILSFTIVSVLFYFFLRSRIQRNQISETNNRNLAELQDAYLQLQDASAAVMRNAVLEERTRIARDIHDAVGHSLTSLIVQMQALRYRIKQDPDGSDRALEEMLSVARQGLKDIRNAVHAMAGDPSLPGIAALRSLLGRAEASASIDCTLDTELTDEDIGVEAYETLFRVLQEAVTNVIRHSEAKRLTAGLTAEQGWLRLRIVDDGVAKPGQPVEEGFGLRMMRKRLEESGGKLQVTALAPHGLEVVAEIPAPDTREEE